MAGLIFRCLIVRSRSRTRSNRGHYHYAAGVPQTLPVSRNQESNKHLPEPPGYGEVHKKPSRDTGLSFLVDQICLQPPLKLLSSFLDCGQVST